MRPIDGAPDNQPVLVWDDEAGYAVAFREGGVWRACVSAEGGTFGPVRLYDGQESDFVLDPSFWLPLPMRPDHRFYGESLAGILAEEKRKEQGT